MRILAIDIGGTHQRFAIVDQDGNILQKEIYPHSSFTTKEDFFREINCGINDWLQKNKCHGIGIALPVVLDEKTGIVYDAPNLPFLKGTCLKKELTEVHFENDANCAALGEAWLGAGKNKNSFCFLTLGTGVGGGLILNKKLWKGERGMACEIGHIKIDMSQQYCCACGDYGCLEAFASALALYKKTGISSKELYIKAQEGDQTALNMFREMGNYLGRGVASIANFLNIDCFILGGQLSGAFEFFGPSTIETAKASAMKGPGENIKILPSPLGDNAGLLGAAYLCLNS